MATFKTPGVYVQEVTKFPPSVAPVATAIPAFIGYTEKATEVSEGDLYMTPKRITSLLDYETYFGLAQNETDLNVEVTTDGKIIVSKDDPSDFRMYYSLQMYFANGGGPCYVVSSGYYEDTVSLDDVDTATGLRTHGLSNGLAAIRKEDEPTLIVFTDAQALDDSSDFYSLGQDALSQCADLQDRFAILDTKGDNAASINNFRNGIGIDNLRYGAAYYPFLDTILNYQYNDTEVSVESFEIDSSEQTVMDIANALDIAPLSTLIGSLNSTYDIINTGSNPVLETNLFAVRGEVSGILNYLVALKEDYENMATIAADSGAATEATALDTIVTEILDPAIDDLETISDTINNTVSKTTIINNLDQNSTNLYGVIGGSQGAAPTTANFVLLSDIDNANSTQVPALVGAISASSFVTTLDLLENTDNDLYNRIRAAISSFPVTMPPSSAMAGIYARVDNARGVWNAPANTTVQFVQQPTVKISNEDQEDMNVTTSGKSVNAIRTFVGKGTLVWGARTLAGNDNKWRYIQVRRLFNFVEESVSEATEQFVFEANVASTWVRIQTLIENFLNDLWKAGGLAGAIPEDAYYVSVGLGQTMTSQDILEGRLIVEIGMAAVRPAEFIVLRFSQKMQES